MEAGFRTVKADSNKPIVFSGGVTIYSPVNATYYTNSLNLNLTCNCGVGLKIYFSYDIDGKDQYPITLTFNDTSGSGFQIMALGSALIQLPRLSGGQHQLTVFEDAYLYGYLGANPPGAPFKPTYSGSHDYLASWVDTVYFTIDSNDGSSDLAPPNDFAPPTISLLSIENKTYEASDLPLNFTLNEPVSVIKFSLDGEENVTVFGNVTLAYLLNGEHNVTVYAIDEAGNVGSSETVVFTVAKPEPFPTTLVITAFCSSLAAVGVRLLAYFKKRKRGPTIPASRLNEQFRKEMDLLSEDLTTQTTFKQIL
jgi:hypothetical protein